MSERARVLNQLEGSHRLVKELVGDVLDDEARRVPAANLSPITWQVGHLAFADATFGRHARGAYTVPENYAGLFKTGTGGHASYPEFNEVLEAFDASHQMLAQLAGEADFASPMTILPGAFNSLGEMFIFVCAHRGYHAGKIGTLRCLLGKPRVFG
jgi:DinB family protein